MKITFFNYWHHGDCFISKGWVNDIINQIPEAHFLYAHNLHPAILKDIKAEYVYLNSIEPLDTNQPVIVSTNGDIFINTWCGCFTGSIIPLGQHSNFVRQHEIYKCIARHLSTFIGREIAVDNDPRSYLPTTDFSQYDAEIADKFVETLDGKTIVLFCNNQCMSGQSNISDLRLAVHVLSILFPDHVFITSKKIDSNAKNVFNTSEIFNKDSDLNEIGYLSKYAKYIIGNNSGPHIYTHIKENLFDVNKTFVALGNLPSDYYAYGSELPCKIMYSDVTNDMELIKIFKQLFESDITR